MGRRGREGPIAPLQATGGRRARSPARRPGPGADAWLGLVQGGLAVGLGAILYLSYFCAVHGLGLLDPGQAVLLDPVAILLAVMAGVAGSRRLAGRIPGGPGPARGVELAGRDEIVILASTDRGEDDGAGGGFRPSHLVEAPRCEYCRCPISWADRVDCMAWETPHHRDCWEEGVGCTTYGCNGTEAVRRAAGVG